MHARPLSPVLWGAPPLHPCPRGGSFRSGCDLFGSDPSPTTVVNLLPSLAELDAVGETRNVLLEVLDQDGRTP
jgi:hypothetical protein